MNPDRETLHRFWKTHIAPACGLPRKAAFSEKPEDDATELHFVSTTEGDYVLRFYTEGSHARLRNYLLAHTTFSSLGICVPEIIGQGRLNGHRWLVESKVAGKSYRNLLEDDQAVRKAASALACLHSNERGRYGEVGTWGGFRLTLRWRQRFGERWEKILRLFPEFESITEFVAGWVRVWAEDYSQKKYQLLHGDYHPGNLCLTPEGKVAFLDLRTPRYGLGLLEMIEAAHHFRGEEPSDWEPFLSEYLDTRGPETRLLYERWSTSLHAVFHLRHADRFADLAVGGRGSVADRRRWEKNALDSLHRFARLAGISVPPVDAEGQTAFPGGT